MTYDRLVAQMDSAVRLPGVTNAWTMPIKARIDMLATGIRTPVGVKVFGPDLAVLERVGRDIERAVQKVPGTRSAFAERAVSGLLPRHRHRPRGGGAVRAQRRRRAGRDLDRDRRDGRHADGRGTRALRRARALSAGAARHAGETGRRARAGGDESWIAGRRVPARRWPVPICPPWAAVTQVPLGQLATIKAGGRTDGGAHRGRAADGVGIRGRRRTRHRQLREGRAGGGREIGRHPGGLQRRRGAASTSTCCGRRRR